MNKYTKTSSFEPKSICLLESSLFTLKPQRAVFQHAGVESFGAKVAKNTEATKANEQTDLTTEAPFNADPQKTFEDLAKGKKTNPENIANSIAGRLKSGETLQNFWKYLENSGADTCKIENRDLRVMKGTTEIDLTGFFKPLTLKLGKDDVTQTEIQERPHVLEAQRNARQELMNSILSTKKPGMKLPPPPSNLQ